MKRLRLIVLLIAGAGPASAVNDFWIGFKSQVTLSFGTATDLGVNNAPTPLSTVTPSYPASLLVQGVAGEITVDFTVKADGSISGVVVIKSTQKEFEDPTLAAIRAWTFAPAVDVATFKPVDSRLRCIAVFSLAENERADPNQKPNPAPSKNPDSAERPPAAGTLWRTEVVQRAIAAELRAFLLEPLSADTSGRYVERYRFFWRRSHHLPALFEVRVDRAGVVTYEASLWSGPPLAFTGWVAQRKVTGPASGVHPYRDLIAKAGFFDLPYTIERGGFEGSNWSIEVIQDGKYHAVYRWSPQAGPLYDFGRALIESAVQSAFLPVY